MSQVCWYYRSGTGLYDPAWVRFLMSVKPDSIPDRFEVDAALEDYNAMQSIFSDKYYIWFDSEADLSFFLLRFA